MTRLMISRYILLLLLLCGMTEKSWSQTVYHHISNKAVYEFLNEMAAAGHIEINSAVLPYSRMFIARQLHTLDSLRSRLNHRQNKELDLYLKDFNKELMPDKQFDKRRDIFYYKDSLFTLSANIILGFQYWTNSNGNTYHRWNGGEVFSYIGKHWGIYASLRDNHETEKISDSPLLTRRMGGNYKAMYDYSEMRGGITYTWGWGSIGLIKDHHTWGNNHHGSIIQSGRTPSFAKIDLYLNPVRWFDFRYFHGWLVSEEVDSTRSYWTQSNYGLTYRKVNHPKYFAANIFTFTPIRKLKISAGNSIVYAGLGVHAAYLIPVFFYKSVDHTVNASGDNQNSQMFLDISSRNIRNVHLYGSFFIDELAIGRMTDPAQHSNFWSWKLGARVYSFPLENLSFTAEYTQSNPLTFRHPTPTLTYASNRYNLGHYLTDNAIEYYAALAYKPIRGMYVSLSYTLARKGPDYTEIGGDRLGLPFMETVEWENKALELKLSYQVINDLFVFAHYKNSHITGAQEKYTHPLWHGKTNTFSAGVNFGF